METGTVNIRSTNSVITAANRWDHSLARWGVNRAGHRIEPGLYALGKPGPSSPVLVTANYTLSFDALRSSLAGIDAYILVLDTRGINVWCAAGKGTFGTDMLVHMIANTRLAEVANHRKLILPQLGATGVAAHEVAKRSGFSVEYGPIRAEDIPTYLQTGKATEAMRQVRFNFTDRAALVPVEFVHVILYMLAAGVAFYFAGGWLGAAAAVTAFFAGAVLFPLLLPFIPTRDLSSRGFILGGVAALAFAIPAFFLTAGSIWWWRAALPAAYLLAMPPVTAFLALNFTGATTFTSKTGVRREMFRYIPVMAWWFGAGVALIITLLVLRLVGVVS